MIAEGIYNPVTGETVKVQGAGTVYNEEKNSIALGKDTVASGQDQFVFGRSSVADAGKAEIVGGGGSVVTIERTDASYAGMKWYIGVPIVYIGTGDKLEAFLNTKTKDEWIDLLVGDVEEENRASWISSFNSISSIVAPSSSKHLFLLQTEPRTYATIMCADTNQLSANTSIAALNASINNGVMSFELLSRFKISNIRTASKYNIRTLDWEGNESLSGDLTIGGSLKIGGVTITGSQLESLLALLNNA